MRGPRIYGAGRILSTTGGHGDMGDLAADLDVQRPVRVVDGPDDIRRVIREIGEFAAAEL